MHYAYLVYYIRKGWGLPLLLLGKLWTAWVQVNGIYSISFKCLLAVFKTHCESKKNHFYAIKPKLLLLIYIRLEISPSIDESFRVTNPRKNLEEEYLDVEAKVCMILIFVWMIFCIVWIIFWCQIVLSIKINKNMLHLWVCISSFILLQNFSPSCIGTPNFE